MLVYLRALIYSICFSYRNFISCQQDAAAVARFFPPRPESGEVPEDVESEDLAEDESEAEASEEGEETEDDEFILTARNSPADELKDTAASRPSTHDDDADAPSLTDAAAKPSAPEARKRTTGTFADEDSLFSS